LKTENAQSPEKPEEIINAAQRRFGIYGLKKTSMREIAEDLHMSKASLYYYFPDKEHLYAEVVMKEQNEMLEILREKTKSIEDPAAILREYVNIRLSYFRAMLNLNQLRFEDIKQINPFIGELWNQFHQKEAEIIKQIFQAGMEKHLFMIDKVDETVNLFLDLLRGLRQQVITAKGQFFIDNQEYETLIYKTNAFIDLFIKALQYNPSK
jgi:AcrR family transcriptional regulator